MTALVKKIEKPKKADFRQRAHCNPLADFGKSIPKTPKHVNWADHYPKIFGEEEKYEVKVNTNDHPITYPDSPIDSTRNGIDGSKVAILDIGCGFGGLLMDLSPLFPDKLSLGMEIRNQVSNYVGQRIIALRQEDDKGHNISILRTNVMKTITNYFHKHQLEKMFFCFPDPQFKKRNWRRRIISDQLLSVYAYLLQEGGKIYTITDVGDLHDWMKDCLDRHPLFEPVEGDEHEQDPCLPLIRGSTEEGQKVKNIGRFGHESQVCIYRRLLDPQ